LAAGLENLEILNVTGNTIVPIAGYDDNPEGSTDANSFGIAILDDCVFIADWQDGLEIFEVSNKSNPMEISQLKYGHHATSVCINDSYAFLSDGGFLLEVIYIADPANPLSLGGLYTSGHGNAVVVQNDLILIAEYNSGLQIYSVILSPPSQTPTPPPLIPTTSPTTSVTFGFEFLILPFLFLFSFIILYFKKKCET
jgi:hypothetical protein